VSQISKDINAVDRCLRRNRREYMEPLGLKGIHAWIVVQVCSDPGCSQDQLAKRSRFDKSTIARQVELMEDMGFIERRPSKTDKRVLCVYPTEKMLQFQPGLQASMEACEDQLLKPLSEEEKQQFRTLLRRICSAIETGD